MFRSTPAPRGAQRKCISTFGYPAQTSPLRSAPLAGCRRRERVAPCACACPRTGSGRSRRNTRKWWARPRPPRLNTARGEAYFFWRLCSRRHEKFKVAVGRRTWSISIGACTCSEVVVGSAPRIPWEFLHKPSRQAPSQRTTSRGGIAAAPCDRTPTARGGGVEKGLVGRSVGRLA